MTFAELEIHPALASALTARGYDMPTSVQAAVLAADCAGRDLLVSSQTGSGKTIAFGAAMVGTLLGPTETRIPHGPKPIALVIVPTRELAAQVREELRWLLHATQVRLASFTGGTPVGGDLKALQRGVELVIGTPGRLVDLIRRTRLDLSDLKVVVLDEADEMLDLGFREDLETLLQAAPATRRTLLLSATLPAEIRALARRYQRDALAIDPRKDAGGAQTPGKGAHDDITHRAHLVAGGDRLAAVVNVLRADESGRAIVFCTTREGVADMHAALVARGFAATAISGDRAQAERDRALDQLRRGDVRVLVATNVAARGLHLPDVDLIVHADLPLNADSLIHRSGRTGRAGRKGTAVVIATPAERRKAERLLGAAHVQAAWTPPPSAETIAAAARARFADELLATEPAAADDGTEDLLARLEDKLPARELARRLLARELGRLPSGEAIREVPVPTGRSGADAYQDGPPEARRTRGEFSREGVVFSVSLGGKDNADPRWLLPLICRRGGVTRNEVGSIRIGPRETLFEIAGDAAHDFALAASVRDPRAPNVTIQRAEPRASRDAMRAPRPTAPQGGYQKGAAPRRGAPQGGYQKGPAPHSGAPQGGLPKGPAPHSSAPQGGLPKGPAPHSSAPQSVPLKGPAPHSSAPQSGHLKGPAPHSGLLKGPAPHSSAPQGRYLKDGAPRSVAPQGGLLKGPAPHSSAPQGGHLRGRGPRTIASQGGFQKGKSRKHPRPQ